MGLAVSESPVPLPQKPQIKKETIDKVFNEQNQITDGFPGAKGGKVIERDVATLKDKLAQIESYSVPIGKQDIPSDAKINTKEKVIQYQTTNENPHELFISGAKIIVTGEAKLTVPPNEGKAYKANIPGHGTATMLEFEINGKKVIFPLNENDINVVQDRNTGKTYYIDLTKDGSVNVHVETKPIEPKKEE